MNDIAVVDESVDESVAARSARDYVAAAAAGDLYEIEVAGLALAKTANADIKALAEMIRRDHEKSTVDLRGAAKQSQPSIAVDPRLNGEQEADVQALRAAQGAQFDQTYLQQQVAAHEKTLAMVRNYAQNGDAPALQQHASQVAGPVEQHLERARALLQQTR